MRATLVFDGLIRKGPQMPNTEPLLYQTDKSSHLSCSIKEAVLKNFSIFTGKHLCWSFFFNFIKRDSNTGVFMLQNFLEHQFWRTSTYSRWTDFRKWLFGTLFLDSRFQNHPDLVMSQKYQSLSNQSFKHNSAYVIFIFNPYASSWT